MFTFHKIGLTCSTYGVNEGMSHIAFMQFGVAILLIVHFAQLQYICLYLTGKIVWISYCIPIILVHVPRNIVGSSLTKTAAGLAVLDQRLPPSAAEKGHHHDTVFHHICYLQMHLPSKLYSHR